MPLLCWTIFLKERSIHRNIKRSCSFSPTSKQHAMPLLFAERFERRSTSQDIKRNSSFSPTSKLHHSTFCFVEWLVHVNRLPRRFEHVWTWFIHDLWQYLLQETQNCIKFWYLLWGSNSKILFFYLLQLPSSHNYISFLIQFFAKNTEICIKIWLW